jgi:hypothetical protein
LAHPLEVIFVGGGDGEGVARGSFEGGGEAFQKVRFAKTPHPVVVLRWNVDDKFVGHLFTSRKMSVRKVQSVEQMSVRKVQPVGKI